MQTRPTRGGASPGHDAHITETDALRAQRWQERRGDRTGSPGGGGGAERVPTDHDLAPVLITVAEAARRFFGCSQSTAQAWAKESEEMPLDDPRRMPGLLHVRRRRMVSVPIVERCYGVLPPDATYPVIRSAPGSPAQPPKALPSNSAAARALAEVESA